MVLCIICLKPIKNSVNLDCNHNYHFKCLKEKNINLKCVLCNSPIKKVSKNKKIIGNILSKINIINNTRQGYKYKFNLVIELFKFININIGWIQTKLMLRNVILVKIEEFINNPKLKIMKINFIEKFNFELNKTKDYLNNKN